MTYTFPTDGKPTNPTDAMPVLENKVIGYLGILMRKPTEQHRSLYHPHLLRHPMVR